MRAVRFDTFGDVDVLDIRQVDDPAPPAGGVVVEVKAAAINPGENFIRIGLVEHMWPTTFPSGQGSDLAGRVVAVADGITDFAVGDAVFGWTDQRASHAELVAVPTDHIVHKPKALPWAVAGSMYVAPMAALASVEAVTPKPGEVVAVSAAAGGVGHVAVQLAAQTGATVIGIASQPHHAWLRSHGVLPVAYGDGLAERIRQAGDGRLDAFIDTFGNGYVDLAIELGVPAERINTVIDIQAVRRYGVQLRGCSDAGTPMALAELADQAATGELDIVVARHYPLDQVRAAYTELNRRHTHGKIVLLPGEH